MPLKLTVESKIEPESEESPRSTVHSESFGRTAKSYIVHSKSPGRIAESEPLIEHTQNVSSYLEREYKMLEHLVMKEGKKLQGLENYHVWSLKTRSIFKAERLWFLTETKQTLVAFLMTIQGKQLTVLQLETRKAIACRLILISVVDDLISLIADYCDHSEA